MTISEITQIIQLSQWGEYDALHEWSPFYTLKDKTDFLAEMLNDWEKTEPEGKKLILQFIRALIQDASIDLFFLTDKLVFFDDFPEIRTLVKEFLSVQTFCLNILLSLKKHSIRQSEWLEEIEILISQKKWPIPRNTIDRKKIRKQIEALFEEIK